MDHDVIIVGGSFAGLAAATYLARARRSVCVVDAGLPRNRFSSHSHGFLTQDGSEPAAILATAREQVASYPAVSFVHDTAVRAEPIASGFAVDLASGERRTAARLVLAFGISDELPALSGVAERWGVSVLHCPYCHGYEVRDRRLGVLWTSPLSVHQGTLIPEWGPTTLFLNGMTPTDDAMAEIARRGVTVEAAPVEGLIGEGRTLSAVVLAGGREVPLDALFMAAPTRLNSDIAEHLGCSISAGMSGPIISVDATQQTSVPGVFAAGDIARGAHAVSWAVSDGAMSGVAAHRSLVFPAAG